MGGVLIITCVILSFNIFLLKVDSIELTSLPWVGASWAIPSDADLSYFNSPIYFDILKIEEVYKMVVNFWISGSFKYTKCHIFYTNIKWHYTYWLYLHYVLCIMYILYIIALICFFYFFIKRMKLICVIIYIWRWWENKRKCSK